MEDSWTAWLKAGLSYYISTITYLFSFYFMHITPEDLGFDGSAPSDPSSLRKAPLSILPSFYHYFFSEVSAQMKTGQVGSAFQTTLLYPFYFPLCLLLLYPMELAILFVSGLLFRERLASVWDSLADSSLISILQSLLSLFVQLYQTPYYLCTFLVGLLTGERDWVSGLGFGFGESGAQSLSDEEFNKKYGPLPSLDVLSVSDNSGETKGEGKKLNKRYPYAKRKGEGKPLSILRLLEEAEAGIAEQEAKGSKERGEEEEEEEDSEEESHLSVTYKKVISSPSLHIDSEENDEEEEEEEEEKEKD